MCANYINNYHKSWIFLALELEPQCIAEKSVTAGGNFYSSLSLYYVPSCFLSYSSPAALLLLLQMMRCTMSSSTTLSCYAFTSSMRDASMQQLGSQQTWDHLVIPVITLYQSYITFSIILMIFQDIEFDTFENKIQFTKWNCWCNGWTITFLRSTT